MWKFAIPDKILDKLRCSLCKEYLSQLPVYIYPGQEGIACGRCPVLSEQNPIRDVTYETIASCLHFPCRFKPYGCLDSFLLNYIKTHEDSCSYKQYFCPFIPLASCPWQGPSHELISHYQDHHAELLLNEPMFEVDLVNMYENNYLLEKDDEIFLIHSKCDSSENSFWCQIRYIGNKNMANKFTYQVQLKKNNSLESVTLTKKVMEDDTSTTLDKYTAVHVKSADITKALGDPCSVLCVINISPNEVVTEDSTDLGHKIPLTNLSSDGVDTDILMELECPVCAEYMVPPIYQCVVGHSICAACKADVQNCPTCRQNILDTRNFSLENLTRFLKYHCKYRDFDCPFVSSSTEIKTHESSCKYGPYACPLDKHNECKWKGKLVDVMSHVRLAHEDNVFDFDIITWSFETDRICDEFDEDCYVKNVFKSVFKLHFKYEAQVFYWCMQYVGPSEEAKEYKFELDFCDDSYLSQRLYIRKECCKLLPYEETFTNDSCIKIPLDLMRPFIEKDSLVYKCHIIKE